MQTKRVTWSSQHDCAPGDYNTVVCHDRVAIVSMTENLPLVQLFDGEGNRTDCGQYQNIAEVGEALAKALRGEKLTMTRPTTGAIYRECPHCNSSPVLEGWYFCPVCGGGIKPLPCEHYPETNAANCTGPPPVPEMVTPELVVMDGAVIVKCPRCQKQTERWMRSWWAVKAWNNGDTKVEGPLAIPALP